MKKRICAILLVASMALNAAFVISYFWGGKGKPVEEQQVQLDRDLNLSKNQENEIQAIIRTFRLTLLRFKQDILSKRMEIVEELGDPEFNSENLTAKVEELNELENRLNLAFIDTIIEVSGILNSSQRIDFLLKLSRNWFFVENGGSDHL
jgi:Spy/CpxP family protein refolding chaperone